MPEPMLAFSSEQNNKKLESTANIRGKTAGDVVKETMANHLYIAFCGPIGSGLSSASETLKTSLEKRNYTVEIIKLSGFIETFVKIPHNLDNYELTNKLMSEGNMLREKYDGHILATLAISHIQKWRKDHSGEPIQGTKHCFIIDSIKNKSELELFRLIYRDSFYLIGVFMNEDDRKHNLVKKGMRDEEAQKLITRDYDENVSTGQSVKSVFYQSDYFVRYIDHHQISKSLDRFVSLIVSRETITPTIHERAMNAAWVASVNSACRSRQVGAALVSSDGTILSTGWNDVPKFGGGLYHSDDEEDKRCFNCSDPTCANDREKAIIINTLVKEIQDSGLINNNSTEKLRELLTKGPIKSLIEFSRSVHAEMFALIQAGKICGQMINGGSIYCTTYPCHNCARHLVAAGINYVYYIEPYSKSKAIDLHNDSIDNKSTSRHMHIIPYEGIGPNCYIKLFSSAGWDRKTLHEHTANAPSVSENKIKITLKSLNDLERLAITTIEGLVNSEEIRRHEPNSIPPTNQPAA
jgi:deoxycytidylate deaminase